MRGTHTPRKKIGQELAVLQLFDNLADRGNVGIGENIDVELRLNPHGKLSQAERIESQIAAQVGLGQDAIQPLAPVVSQNRIDNGKKFTLKIHSPK